MSDTHASHADDLTLYTSSLTSSAINFGCIPDTQKWSALLCAQNKSEMVDKIQVWNAIFDAVLRSEWDIKPPALLHKLSQGLKH